MTYFCLYPIEKNKGTLSSNEKTGSKLESEFRT